MVMVYGPWLFADSGRNHIIHRPISNVCSFYSYNRAETNAPTYQTIPRYSQQARWVNDPLEIRAGNKLYRRTGLCKQRDLEISSILLFLLSFRKIVYISYEKFSQAPGAVVMTAERTSSSHAFTRNPDDIVNTWLQ